MKKILPIVLVFVLFCCIRENNRAGNEFDSAPGTTINEFETSQPHTARMNEYETSYRSLDSDSLEIQDEEFNKTIAHFRASGRKIKEMKYGGGDCWGKFVQIVMGSDTVTIDKYDCGDYGFGNSQFIVHNDSLTKIREFRMEWSPDGNGYAFNVMEQILEFDPDHLTTKNRVGSTEGWEDFRFLGTPFEILRTNGATEYLRLKNELREMVLREKLEP